MPPRTRCRAGTVCDERTTELETLSTPPCDGVSVLERLEGCSRIGPHTAHLPRGSLSTSATRRSKSLRRSAAVAASSSCIRVSTLSWSSPSGSLRATSLRNAWATAQSWYSPSTA